jgi:AcrR family transcriptional regulator
MTTTTSARTKRRPVTPRAEQVATNRRQLLAAAHEVFRELGYARASLDEIADRAGFTKGAVYSHFRSKADLFLSLLEERIEQRAAAQRERATASMTSDEVAMLVVEAVGVSRTDPRWRLAVLEFRVVAARDDVLNARYAAAHRKALDSLVETLRAMFAALDVRPRLPVQDLAEIAFALDNGGFLEDAAIPGAMPSERVAQLFNHLAGFPTPTAGPSQGRGNRKVRR